MKKIFFAAFAGLLCFFTLCNSNTGSTTGNSNDTQKQKNLAANELIIQAFETGDVSKVDSAVSEDFLDHTDRGDMRGRDSLKAAVKWVHENMKRMKAEKVCVVAYSKVKIFIN